jgi:ABC transport system ATP-binding/permease protein
MNLISISNISKNMGNKKLFENITFGIDKGQKIGLIGVNGCGKTTLLRIIAGLENTDSGSISRNRDTIVSYLEQINNYNLDNTILENIFSSNNPLITLIKRYEELCISMSNNNSSINENEFHKITEEMDKHKAWEYEHQIKSVLNELEINNLSGKMKNLSGGMIKKVSLAECLISNANLIIMDEPTNHIDLKTIKYVEEYLKNTDKAIFLVTHDRYFLDSVCDTIIEIDRNMIYKYEGNYSYYLEKKSEIENNLIRDDERIENLLRKELEWYKRQPKARTTKSKSRMDSIDKLMEHEKFKNNSGIEITISGRKLGRKILELNDISKSFSSIKVINKFSYIFKQNEKIGIIGPNGSGKTTFLNILTGKLNPDSGKIDTGINTEFGYFTQSMVNMPSEMKIIDFIKQSAEVIELNNGKTITAEKMLERFLFSADSCYTVISNLSGGEKRRLFLLNILMKNPNFLILDEPTNDLDIKTLAILEDFLYDFGGCLVVVSHDRYFLNRIVDHLFVFDDKGDISNFPGNYQDYLDFEESKKDNLTAEKYSVKKEEQKQEKEKIKLTFKEKQELNEIIDKIDKLEKEKKMLEEKFGSSNLEHEMIKEMTIRHENVEKELTELINRWEYLASFSE